MAIQFDFEMCMTSGGIKCRELKHINIQEALSFSLKAMYKDNKSKVNHKNQE